MKSILIGICFAACLVEISLAAKVQCKPGDTFIPYPDDCSKYYTCSNGEPFEQSCPPGYWFNPANKFCDFPSNVDPKYCPQYNCEPGKIDFLNVSNSCEEYILCYDGVPIRQKCAEGLEFDPATKKCVLFQDSTCDVNLCPEESDDIIFLPDKRSCNTYYICVNGEPVKQECAEGLEWSTERERCELNTTANCTRKFEMFMEASFIPLPQPITFSIPCQPFGIDFFPSPTQCEYYFGCKDGKSHMFDCPNGYGWDAEDKICKLKYKISSCNLTKL